MPLSFIMGFFFLTGCSTLWQSTRGDTYTNSALSNQHPASAKMSPQEKVGEAEILDPLYLREQADYHYSLGESLSLEGKSEKAIEEFKLTLVYDAQSVSVRLRLAAEYIKQGLTSEALEQAEKAVQMDPKTESGRMLLASIYSTLKMHDAAMEQYESVAIDYPKNMTVKVYIGALLAEQGKYEESVKTFMELAKNPDNEFPYKAYYYVGRVRFEQGKGFYNHAEKAFLKSLSLEPDNKESVSALAELYDKMKKPEMSLQILASFQDKFGPEQSIAETLSMKYLEKEDYDKALTQLEYLEGFEPENLNAKVKMALIYIEQKKYDSAIEKLEEILRQAPESDKIKFYLGAVYEELKRPERAIQYFSGISSGSSYYPESAIHVANLYKQKKELDKAVSSMETALKLRTDIPQMYSYYVSLLEEKKQYKKAVTILTKALQEFPDHVQLRFFLGTMYDHLGQYQKTVESMKTVVGLDGNYTQALNFLAYTYANKGEHLDEAEGLALKALGLSPKDSYILDTVGWVYFKQGRYQESIKYLEAAYKNNVTESIIAEHLGDVYYRVELVDKAKLMYKKALASEKDEERLRELQSKISLLDKQHTSPIHQVVRDIVSPLPVQGAVSSDSPSVQSSSREPASVSTSGFQSLSPVANEKTSGEENSK